MHGGSWHGVTSIYLIPLRQEILSSQVETALAEQLAHPRLIILSLLRLVAQKFRREMHLKRESFRDFSETKKLVV